MHNRFSSEHSAAEPLPVPDAAFPAARYFQVHFEYLQQQFQQTLSALEALQYQVHQLERRLAQENANPARIKNSAAHADYLPKPAKRLKKEAR